MEKGSGPEFLQQKYQLGKAPEVQRAVERKARRQKERVRNVPADRIQVYLDALHSILNPQKLEGHKGFDRKARNISTMKRFMYRDLIVKTDIATDQYLGHQQKQARNRGYGDSEIPDDVRNRVLRAGEAIVKGSALEQALRDFSSEEKQAAEEIVAKIAEQKHSLDHWVDYFVTDDANVAFPDWFRYWAFEF